MRLGWHWYENISVSNLKKKFRFILNQSAKSIAKNTGIVSSIRLANNIGRAVGRTGDRSGKDCAKGVNRIVQFRLFYDKKE